METLATQATPSQGFLVWSAIVDIRRKALVSSVGFRKRMTSRSPRGIYNVCLFDGLLMLLLRSCTDYWAACAPSHKMGFRSSVSKSGLPGEGRHEDLVPRNDVLTNGFI